MKRHSKSGIENEIEITASSQFDESCQPQNVILFDDKYKSFISKNASDSWLCIEFLKNRIVPKNYSIRSYNCSPGGYHPKSWVIEGSNDKNKWVVIDERNNCTYLNGCSLVHTFNIENQNDGEYKYIRMRATSPDCNVLAINSIELFGQLL